MGKLFQQGKARAKAVEAEVKIDFIRADARDFRFEAAFDSSSWVSGRSPSTALPSANSAGPTH